MPRETHKELISFLPDFKFTLLALALTPNSFMNKVYLALLLLFSFSANAQSIAVFSGSIKNSSGTPIDGATIYLLNTNFRTATNDKGWFELKRVPAGKYQLQVSAVGYATMVKDVEVSNNNTPVNLQLASESKKLDEIVVTAQKRDEELQKEPLAITAFSAKQVDDDRLWTIKDITAYVPNLYAANPGDNRNVVSIRGITTTSYDQAVATYVDGVNQFGLDTYIAQLEDIDHIEVLRGPQGSLYGRDAMGGVINIITRQPTNEFKGFADVDFGNYGLQRYNLGFRAPLVKDKLFLGASWLYTTQDGFYINEYTHSRFDDQHSLMGNYYLKYLASDNLSITLNVKHVENRNNGAFPLAADPATALAQPFTVDQNAVTTLIDNIFNGSLSINYTRHDFNFTSQSAYQSNYRYYKTPIDADFSPLDGISIVDNYGPAYNKVKVGTQEFRFSSPASQSAFKWVGGLYGFREDNPVKQGTYFGDDAKLFGSPMTDFTSIDINNEKLYGAAIFGQATYTFNKDLDVTVGLRYDYEHDNLSIEGEFQPNGQPATITQADTSAGHGFHALSPNASAYYHITGNNGLYATYSRGFRTGGISQLSSDPTQPPLYAYDPETSNNYELGSKNTFFNDRLRFNADVFYTTVNNAQVPTLILPDAITIIRNAGKLHSYGAEAELMAKLFEGLEADYSFGYTHARYTSLLLSNNGTTANLNGNQQVFTPDITSLLALQYERPLDPSAKYKFIARAEWKYLGKQYFDLANTITQNPYNVFDGRVGVSTKNYGLYLWGGNLFNKHYIDYAYDFGASHLGNPRTFGVSLMGRF
jgi:iron complex outermembrane recepter protein